MPRHSINRGIEAADAAKLFEIIEAADRAGRLLGNFVTVCPSKLMLDAERRGQFAEVRKRLVQTSRRHDMPAIGVFIHEKKLHDPQRAGLHLHSLWASPRHMSEPLLRSLTSASVEHIGRGKWKSKNECLNAHIEPNKDRNGIYDRGRYLLKERSERHEADLIDQGMIDEHWGEVWKLEAPAPIWLPRIILTTDAENLLAADRDRRPKFYPMPPVMQIEVEATPEPTAPQPKLRIVVSNPLIPEPSQPSLFASCEKPISRLAQYGGGDMPAAVAQEIEARRRWRGLTQEAVARQIGISRCTLTNALHGKFGLSAWAAARLREFLLLDKVTLARAA